MSNELVSYSRAGDVFHYRWAARRCLRLIYPNTTLKEIVVEGSLESEKAGEYGIDLCEYIDTGGANDIDYYQLKHTTVRSEAPFQLAGLKDTITHFAARFRQHTLESDFALRRIHFRLVTNRVVDTTVKQNLKKIVGGNPVDKRFLATLTKYTEIKGNELKAFCERFIIQDQEGGYREQERELFAEIDRIVPGLEDQPHLQSLVTLVQNKVLPGARQTVTPTDVLSVFGLHSLHDLYPAALLVEQPPHLVLREQFKSLARELYSANEPAIVHASGGIGKTVFCQYFISELPVGSFGIHYDCFGSGAYRNRSTQRHRHRDGLVQIANELATRGLCPPILPHQRVLPDVLMRRFIESMRIALQALRQLEPSARLYLLIDAADNAEMAAVQFSDSSFVHELLREVFPDGCQLVLFCRTERIHLLKPPSNYLSFELGPFSLTESINNLRSKFPEATEEQGNEFHRLTGQNPRVQASVLDGGFESTEAALASLGTGPRTVDEQIGHQLATAIGRIKDSLPSAYENNIERICTGLATLPPHIPLVVLSEAAGVSVSEVRSLIADFGRSLWLSDETVQFRDEPTETWFRNNFLATTQANNTYIQRLEPLASHQSYVAMALPQLYLQAGQFEQLIKAALSEDLLPVNNPIDARSILVYRLEFALKAALKQKSWADAVKIAVRAGEEVAGDQRQLALLQSNIDLLPLLQSQEKVQEIAHQRIMSGSWPGSENIYTASLLSGITNFHGEAHAYLRSAHQWLDLQFELQKKQKDEDLDQSRGVAIGDLLEHAYAALNLRGPAAVVDFLSRLVVNNASYLIYYHFTRRLIDLGRINEVDSLLQLVRHPLYQTAIIGGLSTIGRFPDKKTVQQCLEQLNSFLTNHKRPDSALDDYETPALLAVVEAGLHYSLSQNLLLVVLNQFMSIKTNWRFTDQHLTEPREWYLRSLGIRLVLNPEYTISVEDIMPDSVKEDEPGYQQTETKGKYELFLNGLLPLFHERAKLIAGHYADPDVALHIGLEQCRSVVKDSNYRFGRFEEYVSSALSQTLIIAEKVSLEVIKSVFADELEEIVSLPLNSCFLLLRAAYRSPHIRGIASLLESKIHARVSATHGHDDPESISERYIRLARAVITNSPSDAQTYFDQAVTIASKFGDELVVRWEAVVALAKRSAKIPTSIDLQPLAYRFIRCAELVGEHVAREKHWNRAEAVEVTSILSPGAGLAALSRWRDREVGTFRYQMEAVFSHLVDSGQLTASTAWSMTPFMEDEQPVRFLERCLVSATSTTERELLFSACVCRCEQDGSLAQQWEKLEQYAKRFNIHQKKIVQIAAFYRSQENASSQDKYSHFDDPPIANERWETIFKDVVIADISGWPLVLERFNSEREPLSVGRPVRRLLGEFAKRLPQRHISSYLDVLVQCEQFDFYDLTDLHARLPAEWKQSVSFPAKWKLYLKQFGRRFAEELTNEYSFDNAFKGAGQYEWAKEVLIDGIVWGLGEHSASGSARGYFGLSMLLASRLNAVEAKEVTEFSLNRFELHMPVDFGDGPWRPEVVATPDVSGALAGLLWSALGSPRSAVRWKATHCVRNLCFNDQPQVIDLLVQKLKDGAVGAFGHSQFPFYILHATQFLLIALARVATEEPSIVRRFGQQMLGITKGEPHILIEIFTRDIILNIAKLFPEDFSVEQLDQIQGIGSSPYPVQTVQRNTVIQSYWHANNLVQPGMNFPFAIDLDKYWFRPLGSVFGVPAQQVEDLVAEQIRSGWGYREDQSIRDARKVIWNSFTASRETFATHGKHPAAERLDFYLSYHGLLAVASKMLRQMPTLTDDRYSSIDWSEWLQEYILTRSDGFWISDWRDAVPLQRPAWTEQSNLNRDNWFAEVIGADFSDALIKREEEIIWLRVAGGWNERKNVYTTSYYVSSALVSEQTSDALLNALGSYSDLHDYKLPNYEELKFTIEASPFELKGWIFTKRIGGGIDRFDPLTDGLDFQWLSVGKTYADALSLIQSADHRTWADPGGAAAIRCSTWASTRNRKEEEPEQDGMHMMATLPILQQLCNIYGKSLIFEVRINRSITYSHESDNNKYSPDYFQLFILLADGRIYSFDTASGTRTQIV